MKSTKEVQKRRAPGNGLRNFTLMWNLTEMRQKGSNEAFRFCSLFYFIFLIFFCTKVHITPNCNILAQLALRLTRSPLWSCHSNCFRKSFRVCFSATRRTCTENVMIHNVVSFFFIIFLFPFFPSLLLTIPNPGSWSYYLQFKRLDVLNQCFSLP